MTVFLIIICALINSACFENDTSNISYIALASTRDNAIIEKQDILCLMLSYPGYIKNVERDQYGKIYVILASGKKIIYDDKKKKSIQEKFSNPDLKNTMEQIYPLSNINSLQDINFGPGRGRVYDFFNEVYGKSKTNIEKNLVRVSIANKNYSFNRNNGAAESLKAVMKEMIPLAQRNAKINSYVFPISGTYNYRLIAGTNQLSPHSYGIAIDHDGNRLGYWRWTSKMEAIKTIRNYPQNIIVKIFEKNNFIWAGKWGHFDFMHFEYRPELILKAKYFGVKPESRNPWYKGAASNNPQLKKYIEIIDKAFN